MLLGIKSEYLTHCEQPVKNWIRPDGSTTRTILPPNRHIHALCLFAHTNRQMNRSLHTSIPVTICYPLLDWWNIPPTIAIHAISRKDPAFRLFPVIRIPFAPVCQIVCWYLSSSPSPLLWPASSVDDGTNFEQLPVPYRVRFWFANLFICMCGASIASDGFASARHPTSTGLVSHNGLSSCHRR